MIDKKKLKEALQKIRALGYPCGSEIWEAQMILFDLVSSVLEGKLVEVMSMEEIRKLLQTALIWCNTCQYNHSIVGHFSVIELSQAILPLGICKKEDKIKGMLVEFHCPDKMLSQAIGEEVEIKQLSTT